MKIVSKFNILLALIFFIVFSNVSFSKSVSKEKILKLVGNFIEQRSISSDFALAKKGPLNIESIDALTISQTNDVFAYLVNLSPTGFVVIAPDTDIEPIIAYSFRHNWAADTSQSNIFYQILKTDLNLRLKYLDQIPDYIRSTNNQLWQDYLNNNTQLQSDEFQQWPQEGTTLTGGWLETTWTQGAPYNNFCPINPQDTLRCPSGCGATAIAQIANYHKYFGNNRFRSVDGYANSTPPINIDADSAQLDFPSFDELNKYLDTLQYRFENNLALDDKDKAALCFACGIMTQTKYSSSGSATFAKEIYSAFAEKMNYASADFRSVNNEFYEDLITNMKQGLPAELSVLSAADGHAIICDGYNTDDFYHINFGWGAGSPTTITDAWYNLPDGLPRGFNILYSAVINIRPPLDNKTQLVVSDTLIKFQPADLNTPSEIKNCTLQNAGSTELNIEEILLPAYFYASLDGHNFGDRLGPVPLMPGNELTIQIYCLPDSLGKFKSEMEIIVSGGGTNKYFLIDLVGYGSLGTGTVVTDNDVSGIWDQ